MKKQKIHPNLIPLSDLRGYIAQQTGVLVQKAALRRWLRNREIKTINPFDRRKKYITKTEIERFIRKHTQEEDDLDEELKVYNK